MPDTPDTIEACLEAEDRLRRRTIEELHRIARTFEYKADTLPDHLAVMNRVDAYVVRTAIRLLKTWE